MANEGLAQAELSEFIEIFVSFIKALSVARKTVAAAAPINSHSLECSIIGQWQSTGASREPLCSSAIANYHAPVSHRLLH